MILHRLIPTVIALTFSTVALSADYSCEVFRKKGEEQKSVKKFTLKAKPNDTSTEIAKIDGDYSAICQLNLKEAGSESLVCGFANIGQDLDVNMAHFNATTEVKGLEILSLAATNYSNKELITLHTSGDYQDLTYCVKAK